MDVFDGLSPLEHMPVSPISPPLVSMGVRDGFNTHDGFNTGHMSGFDTLSLCPFVPIVPIIPIVPKPRSDVENERLLKRTSCMFKRGLALPFKRRKHFEKCKRVLMGIAKDRPLHQPRGKRYSPSDLRRVSRAHRARSCLIKGKNWPFHPRKKYESRRKFATTRPRNKGRFTPLVVSGDSLNFKKFKKIKKTKKTFKYTF